MANEKNMTDVSSENRQLSCLLIQAQDTDKFISNELTEVQNNIDSCINNLGNDVFSGPIAEVSRKGLSDYYGAIGNPIKVNFSNVSTELKNAYETLVESDLSTKGEFKFIYDDKKGFSFATTTGLVGNSTQEKLFNFLLSKGYNKAAACGILANISAESQFNYNAIGAGGTSYGLCQWHNSKWANLKNYCARNNLDWRSLEGQAEYLVYELETSYSGVNSYIKNVPNTSQGAYDAAYIWTTDFEVCQDKEYWGGVRGQNASSYYWKNFGLTQNS